MVMHGILLFHDHRIVKCQKEGKIIAFTIICIMTFLQLTMKQAICAVNEIAFTRVVHNDCPNDIEPRGGSKSDFFSKFLCLTLFF